MTVEKKRAARTSTSAPYEDFLSIAGFSRAARLSGTPVLPRLGEVSMDRDGYLHWHTSRQRAGFRKIPADLCFRFARLADGSLEEIRRFADRWGPLGREIGIRQQADKWREYARLALAILRFAADFHGGKARRQEDWEIIWGPEREPVNLKGLPWKIQAAVLANAVNRWIDAAKGISVLQVVAGRHVAQISGSNLFGILATQVAYALARADQMAYCAGCGEFFRSRRLPSRGARRYCPICRAGGVPQRDASRDYRERRERRTERT
jgi:hypothetical protein